MRDRLNIGYGEANPAAAWRAGFTLVELMVVVIIIGIIASFAIPYYIKAEEMSKANDGSATAGMVATANRMYAVDHQGNYLSGQLTDALCNGNACLANCGSCGNACDLIGCGYLSAEDWDSKPYEVQAVANSGCSLAGMGACSGSANYAACVTRRTGGSPGTNMSPYNQWGYAVDLNDVVNVCGGAPQPPQ
ncbi:MAG: prepilin-type N-terminal cleavage/methylation domain-containing protein [Elusimicrobiota bacterium]